MCELVRDITSLKLTQAEIAERHRISVRTVGNAAAAVRRAGMATRGKGRPQKVKLYFSTPLIANQ